MGSETHRSVQSDQGKWSTVHHKSRESLSVTEAQKHSVLRGQATILEFARLRGPFPRKWQGLDLDFTDMAEGHNCTVHDCQDWELIESDRTHSNASLNRTLYVHDGSRKMHEFRIHGPNLRVLRAKDQSNNTPRDLARADFGFQTITKTGKQGGTIRAWLKSQIGTSFKIQTNQGTVSITELSDMDNAGDDVVLKHEGEDIRVSLAKGAKFWVPGASVSN